MSKRTIEERLEQFEIQLDRLVQQTSRAGLTAAIRDHRPNPTNAVVSGLWNRAVERSLDIVEAEMSDALLFDNFPRFLLYALSKAKLAGSFAEFGVFEGKSINVLASARPDVIFDGFDSFKGLPHEWAGWQEFNFDRKGIVPKVKDNVVLHPGWFEDSLPDYEKMISKLSFGHIDCDLYSSTKTIFDTLGSKVLPGTVLVFDEYFAYPGFENHERKAFKEFLETRQDLSVEWIAVCGERAACIVV